MAERLYDSDEIAAGLPQFHQKLREETGYTGQFKAEPLEANRFKAYMLANPGLQSQVDTLAAQFNAGDFAVTPMPADNIGPTQLRDIQSDVTDITGDVGTLTTGQAGLMTGQQNLQTGVTGLTGDVGALQTDVTNLTGDVGRVQEGVTGLGTQVGTVQEGVTGLETAVGTPGEGQTDLFAGQRGLMSEVGDVGTQVADVSGQVGAVQTGVTGLEQAVGTPAEGDPRTLFAGQQTLLGGQDRLGREIGGGVDRLTGEITNVGADLTALQRASDAYQREAQRQRTLAAQAGQTGREQLQRQVAGVGQQANRVAEAQAAQRLAATPRGMMQMATGVAPTAGPQIAAQTAQAAQQGFRPPAQGVPAPVSPLGPQAQDPRDLVTQLQQLQAQQAGLMAQLGI